jgi:putative tricarboxylic transport membrane protein
MHTKPGGTADVFIRTLAKTLEPAIGESLVIVNAPGGGGASQMSRVRAAKPDGQTIAINTMTHFSSMLTNLKAVFALDDFDWIASAQEDEIILFVKTGSDLKNIDDLVAKARERSGTLNVGGFGPVGSMQYLAISMLETAADIKVNWVGFEATPDITSALLGGHIDVGVSNLGAMQAFFEADRVKGLGVMGAKRLTGLPELPTFEEQGYDVDTSWVQVRGFFGPAGIPMETQQKIADAIHEAMKSEDYQTYARAAGVTDSWMGPVDYTEFVHRATSTADKQLKAAGLK